MRNENFGKLEENYKDIVMVIGLQLFVGYSIFRGDGKMKNGIMKKWR